MGTTAGGLRYPEGSDPANVPVVVQNLAEDVDTFKASKANPTFTGVASFPDGSASAPSITNTGDTNTGLAFPAEDQVAITTGGTERLRVNASGRVGIGTSNPSTTMHLDSSAAFFPQVLLRNTNTDANPPFIILGKSPSDNSLTVADGLGQISWQGVDTGGTARSAAYMNVVAVSQGASHVEGQVGIATTNSSGTLGEKMRIDGNGLITGTGTSLGAWTAYTPTLGGTGWAIGNGSFSAVYCQIGKMVFFKAQFTAGSTTTFGSDSPTITLPVTSSGAARAASMVTAHALDVSTGNLYQMAPLMNSTTTVSLRTLGASGLHTATTSTVPFTWDGATADVIRLAGIYEAA